MQEGPFDSGAAVKEEEFLDAADCESFEAAPLDATVNLDQMAEDFFARVDEIHGQVGEEEDSSVHFEDLSSEEEESDGTSILEDLLRESAKPLFPGSKTSRL